MGENETAARIEAICERLRWMRENNVTDTNKGLALYLGQRQGGGSAPTARPTLTKGQVVGGYEFLGGDPMDRNNWRPSGDTSR